MTTMVTIGKIIGAVKTAATVAVAATVAKGAYDTWNPPSPPDLSSLQTQNFDPNIGGSKYQYAPTQDVNIAYQNYLDSLLKTAPYYVSRYRADNLREGFMRNINVKEKQAEADQPRIHAMRPLKAKIQLNSTRSETNEITEE
jgi:hypothetical protein